MRPAHQSVRVRMHDSRQQESIERLLLSWGFEIHPAPDSQVAANPCRPVDIILTDAASAEMHHTDSIPRILLCSTSSSSDGVQLKNAFPFPLESANPFLLEAIRLVLHNHRLAHQLELSERLAHLGKIVTGLLHELKGPIHNLLLSAEKIEQQLPDDPALARWLAILARNGELVRESIDDLLQGFQERRPRDLVDVIPIVDRAIRYAFDSSPHAHAIQIQRSFEMNHAFVLAPPGYILHVVLNLLTNAQEALLTGNGTIHVQVSPASHNRVAITIRDTGPGVSREVLDRLGEPFVTTKPAGTGLGLALVKRLAEECQGEIEAEAPPGGGSQFTIRLPLQPTDSCTIKAPAHESVS